MIFYTERQLTINIAGTPVDQYKDGVSASNGYISEIIDHFDQIPFSEIAIVNFKPRSIPTTGKLVVRAWREEFSSAAFQSAVAGPYQHGVTFTTPYGIAPVIGEIDYTAMIEGGVAAQVIRQFDIGAAFDKNIPNRYRLIFENSTDANLNSENIIHDRVLCAVYSSYIAFQ